MHNSPSCTLYVTRKYRLAHVDTCCCLLFTVGHQKKDYSRSMGLGLGAVHPKLSGSTIDVSHCIDLSFIHIAYMADYYGNADFSSHSWFMFALQSSYL